MIDRKNREGRGRGFVSNRLLCQATVLVGRSLLVYKIYKSSQDETDEQSGATLIRKRLINIYMGEESRFLASATLIFAFDVHADYREENKRFQTTESSRLCVIGNDGCNLPPPFSSRALAQIDWRSEKMR